MLAHLPRLGKTVTPPRNLNPSRRGSPKSIKSSHCNQVKYSNVAGLEGVYIIKATKPEGNAPPFMAPSISVFEDDMAKKEECGILFFTELRNTDGTDTALVSFSNTGKEYTYDIAVVCLDGGKNIREVCDKYVSALASISANEASDKYRYGVPKFVNKGKEGTDDKPASYYLQDEDCVTLMKRYYGGCQTKEEFANSEFQDAIVTAVWGDKTIGMEVLDRITEEEWEDL